MLAKLAQGAKHLKRWFFEERNRIFQLFYLVLLCISYGTVAIDAWSHCTLVHRIIDTSLFLAVCALFFIVSFSDPGIISKENINSPLKYPDHPFLYPRGKLCPSCKIPKIPRSKHCRICNHCVARFDHQMIQSYSHLINIPPLAHHMCFVYIVWVNTCIGASNYCMFFFFLVANVCGSAHLLYAICTSFIEKAGSMLLLRPLTLASRKEITTLLTKAMESRENALTTFVGSLSALVWLLMSVLMGFHFSRVYRNCTTNEQVKRQYLLQKAAKERTTNRQRRPIDFDMSWGGFGLNDGYTDNQAISASEVEFNPYDLGLIYNVKDAFGFLHKFKIS